MPLLPRNGHGARIMRTIVAKPCSLYRVPILNLVDLICRRKIRSYRSSGVSLIEVAPGKKELGSLDRLSAPLLSFLESINSGKKEKTSIERTLVSLLCESLCVSSGRMAKKEVLIRLSAEDLGSRWMMIRIYDRFPRLVSASKFVLGVRR